MESLEKKLENMMTGSLSSGKTENIFSESVCPICNNTGWERYDKDGYVFAKECKCGIRKKIIHNNRLKFANIPEAFADVRLDNFKKNVYQTQDSQEMIVEMAKAVRYWLRNLENMKERGIGLYLYSGTKGSGKTRLAVSVANELIYKYDTQVKFATSIRILQEIKRTWLRDKTDYEYSESKLLDSLMTVGILIIDDFGAEKQAAWVDEKIYSIIDGRYEDKKITIFTSNMKPDDLPCDERIISRIKERVLQIPFPEESVRDLIASQLKQELIDGIT